MTALWFWWPLLHRPRDPNEFQHKNTHANRQNTKKISSSFWKHAANTEIRLRIFIIGHYCWARHRHTCCCNSLWLLELHVCIVHLCFGFTSCYCSLLHMHSTPYRHYSNISYVTITKQTRVQVQWNLIWTKGKNKKKKEKKKEKNNGRESVEPGQMIKSVTVRLDL